MVVLPVDALQSRQRRGSAISKEEAAGTHDATSQRGHEGHAALMMERRGGRDGR